MSVTHLIQNTYNIVSIADQNLIQEITIRI